MTSLIRKFTFLFAFVLSTVLTSNAQGEIQKIAIKKGEVLDILLISQNQGVEEDLKKYFKTAFPVANKLSYQPQPGFKIKLHKEGNLRPGALILGKWSSLKQREDFLDQIVLEIPSFHEQRRKIWSYFGLRYFEFKEDFELKIDRSKFHVATAFWLNSEQKESEEVYKEWRANVSDMKGEILLKLTDGKSPFGYRYDPDYFLISSWENEEDYNNFQVKKRDWDIKNIQHINEFIIE